VNDKSKGEATSESPGTSRASQSAQDPASGGVQFPDTDDAPTRDLPGGGAGGPSLDKGASGADDPGDGPGESGAAWDSTAKTYAYASIPPASSSNAGAHRVLRHRNGYEQRGTVDFGLFLLRVVVGGTFLYHGLQKLVGWFDGPGMDGTRTMLEQGGWDRPSIAAALLAGGEVAGGALLILGLATPFAAGAVLAVILNAWFLKQGAEPGFQYAASENSVELDTILVGTATVLILTGPGRWSFDRSRGWATRPWTGSLVIFVLAVVAAIGAWWYLHGGNPLTGIGPFD